LLARALESRLARPDPGTDCPSQAVIPAGV